MKRIIDGYMYDTDISELIYFDEDKRRRYYMTQNRHFFMVLTTGEFMIVDEDTMKDILGRFDTDKYIEIFGEPKEG